MVDEITLHLLQSKDAVVSDVTKPIKPPSFPNPNTYPSFIVMLSTIYLCCT